MESLRFPPLQKKETVMLLAKEVSGLNGCKSGDEVLRILRELIKDERYEDVWPAIKEHCSSRECSKSGRKAYICRELIPIVTEHVINKDLKDHDMSTWRRVFREKLGKTWEEVIKECLDKGSPDFSKGISAIKESIHDFKNERGA